MLFFPDTVRKEWHGEAIQVPAYFRPGTKELLVRGHKLHYSPIHTLGSYDPVLLDVARRVVTIRYAKAMRRADPVETEHALYKLTQAASASQALHGVASTHFFGNGTISGQMARFAAVKAVHEFRKKFGPNKRTEYWGGSFEACIQRLDELVPLAARPEDLKLDTNDLFELLKRYSPVYGGKYTLLKFEPKAHSGPGWPMQYVRSLTAIPSLAVSQQILEIIETRPDTYMQDLFHLSVAYMKPKAEVYTLEQYRGKTRNIFNLADFAQNPASMLVRGMTHRRFHYLNHPESISLLGAPLLGGGLETLLNYATSKPLLLDNEVGIAVLVFADNLFLIYSRPFEGRHLVTFHSLDGVKMEASHTRTDMQLYLTRLLSWWRSKGGVLTKGFEGYLTGIFLQNAVENPVLFYDEYLRAPQLGSGVVGTADWNTWKMAMGVMRCLDDHAFDGKFDLEKINASMKKEGIELTHEAVSEAFTWPPQGEARVVRLDLLGFDAIMAEDLCIPVLNYGRLLKAAAFLKSGVDLRKRNVDEDPEFQLYAFVKVRMLYLIGGWAYAGLREILITYCEAAQRALLVNLEDDGLTFDQVVEDVADELNFDTSIFGAAANIMHLLKQNAMPTPEEISEVMNGSLLATLPEVAAPNSTADKHSSAEEIYRKYSAEIRRGNSLPNATPAQVEAGKRLAPPRARTELIRSEVGELLERVVPTEVHVSGTEGRDPYAVYARQLIEQNIELKRLRPGPFGDVMNWLHDAKDRRRVSFKR